MDGLEPLRAAARPRDRQETISPAAAEAEVPPGIRLRTRFEALGGLAAEAALRPQVLDPRPRASTSPATRWRRRTSDFGPEEPVEARGAVSPRYEPIAAPAIALVKPQRGGTVEQPAEGESMHRAGDPQLQRHARRQHWFRPRRARAAFAVPGAHVRPGGRAARHARRGRQGRRGDVRPCSSSRTSRSSRSRSRPSGPLARAGHGAEKTTYAVRPGGRPRSPICPIRSRTVIARADLRPPGWDAANRHPIPLYPSAREWPHADPFTVEIVETRARRRASTMARAMLRVPLPKGNARDSRLSVTPSSARARADGHLAAGCRLGSTRQAEQAGAHGQHWMLTPWRTLELVHAVQKPLIEPEIERQSRPSTSARRRRRPHFVASRAASTRPTASTSRPSGTSQPTIPGEAGARTARGATPPSR